METWVEFLPRPDKFTTFTTLASQRAEFWQAHIMQTWLPQQTPFFIFAGMCVAAFGMQCWWLRNLKFARLPWLVWVLAALLLFLGWQMSEQAGRREWNRIQSLTQNFARLYGAEMERRGPWKLPSNPGGDGPPYLDLIETEKTCEKFKPD